MSTRVPDRTELLANELVRLEGELAILQRQWDRKHWLLLFGLLTVPAYFLFGAVVAGVVFACTPALVVVQTYLLAVRRAECRQLIAEAKRDLAHLRGGGRATSSPLEAAAR